MSYVAECYTNLGRQNKKIPQSSKEKKHTTYKQMGTRTASTFGCILGDNRAMHSNSEGK